MSVESGVQRLKVGEWLIEPALDQISRAGEIVKLEPRMMRLLVRLAATPGQVVSSQQLLDEVWSGVVVGSASLYQAVSQLRKLLGDVDERPSYIATVPRKGYRLIAAVSAPSAESGSAAAADSRSFAAPATAKPAETPQRSWSMRGLAAAVLVGVLLAFASMLWRAERIAAGAASIVVLPFVDLSPDKVDVAFCDGLAEELSTALSNLPALRVVARTSAYAIRSEALDVREIGARLSATHVLEGSVRRTGEVLRVAAQLVDARNGFRSWSASYDVAGGDLMEMQTAIARAVAQAMEIRFPEETPGRIAARGSRNPRAAELYLRARHHFLKRTTPDNARAAGLIERAIALDEDFALAHVALAQARFNEFALDGRPLQEVSAEIARLIDRALELEPELPEAFATRGALLREQHRLGESKAALQRSIALNPNNVQAAANLGRIAEQSGAPREALDHFTRAQLLDPLDFLRQVDRCIALQDLARYAEAQADCAAARRLEPRSEWSFMATSWLARAQGRLAESLRWIDAGLVATPNAFELLMQRADVLMDLAMVDEAKRAVEAAAQIAPNRARIQIALADLALIEGDKTSALARVGELSLEEAEAIDLLEAAQVSLNAGDPKRAAELLVQARAASDFAGLAAKGPIAVRWGVSHELVMAQIDLQAGERETAHAKIRRVLRDAERLQRNGHAGWGPHAVRADAYSSLGEAEQALRELELAAHRGWRSTWRATRDPQLALLRDRPDFHALLARVDALNAVEREKYRRQKGLVGK